MFTRLFAFDAMNEEAVRVDAVIKSCLTHLARDID